MKLVCGYRCCYLMVMLLQLLVVVLPAVAVGTVAAVFCWGSSGVSASISISIISSIVR